MPKINLAQEVVRNQVIARRRRVLYGVSIAILAVTVAVWGTVYFLTTQVEEARDGVQHEVRRLEAQLRTREDDVNAIVLFRERLKSLERMLATHVLWSRVLEELERLVVPEATLTGIKGNVVDQSLVAQARVPSLDAGADLVASLQDIEKTNATFFPTIVVTSLKAIENAAQAGGPSSVTGYTLQAKMTMKAAALQAAAPTAPPAPEASPSEAPAAASPEI